MPRVEIPKAKTATLRYRVKQRTRRDRTYWSLSRQLQELNPILRGWGNFYRYCTNAKEILTQLDWYVGDRLWRWMRKKFPKADTHEIARWRQPVTNGRQKVWCQGPHEQFLMGCIPIRRYRRGWMGKPDYAVTSGEPDA